MYLVKNTNHTSALYLFSAGGFYLRPFIKNVLRHMYTPESLYRDGKNRAIPSLPAGRQAPRYPDIACRDLTLGPLDCRAVSCKAGHHDAEKKATNHRTYCGYYF